MGVPAGVYSQCARRVPPRCAGVTPWPARDQDRSTRHHDRDERLHALKRADPSTCAVDLRRVLIGARIGTPLLTALASSVESDWSNWRAVGDYWCGSFSTRVGTPAGFPVPGTGGGFRTSPVATTGPTDWDRARGSDRGRIRNRRPGCYRGLRRYKARSVHPLGPAHPVGCTAIC